MKALTELIFRAKLNMVMQSCNLDEYEIKLAEAQEEIAGAFEVRKAVYVTEKRWEDESDEDELDNKSVFIIAKRGETYAGCLRLIISGSTIDPNAIEISRLSILKEHRSTGLAVALYIAAQIVLERKFGVHEAVFITKPALAHNIALAIGSITKLGNVKEHKGLRAPYKITFTAPISPGLRKLYESIQSSM